MRLSTDRLAKRDAGVEEGFTLLELLIVLGILALASAFAVPLFGSRQGDAVLISTARTLANTMRLARASAIRDNVERTMTIDLAQRRFWVDGVAAETSIGSGIGVDFITLQKEQLSANQGRLRFFVDGSTTGGNVILRSAGRTVSIKLDWASGHASVRRNPR